MSLKLLRGTTSQVAAYTPASGEPVYDTTLRKLYIGDGVTAGGRSLEQVATALKLQQAFNLALTGPVTGNVNIDGSGNVSISTALASNLSLAGTTALTGGQLAFPAIALPSADPNTLDDYEEGIWTPTLTFATPGDVAVTYSTRVGFYTKVGREVTLRWNIVTSAFTHTTASGSMQISGLPFSNSATASSGSRGVLDWGGINKALYTQVLASVGAGANVLTLQANGMGQPAALVMNTDTPTGGTITLAGTITYMT